MEYEILTILALAHIFVPIWGILVLIQRQENQRRKALLDDTLQILRKQIMLGRFKR